MEKVTFATEIKPMLQINGVFGRKVVARILK